MVLELTRPEIAEIEEAAAMRPAANGTAVRQLAARLSGEIVHPAHPDYDAARQVWNRAVDRYPALVVRAAGPRDVAEAVRYARANGLRLAVRSGGHSMSGLGTLDGGVVLDVSPMKSMTVDPERRVAWAGPGLTWGEYATRASAFGLTTPAGDASTVGVSGLALGGGIGWLVRKHGLTIDHLLSAEVVTADGERITASERENADLFWALRGGGGNFGVATAFEFRMQPVSMVLGGAIVLPAEPRVLAAYARAAMEAPEELSVISVVMHAPPLPFLPAEQHGKLVFMVLVCYAGDPKDPEAGQRALAPLRAIAPAIGEHVGLMPYPALFQMTAEGSVPRPHSVRSGYMDAFGRDQAELIVDWMERSRSPFGMAQVRVLGGAMARVPAAATAFAHRDKPFMATVIDGWDDPADGPGRVAWTEDFWRALRPHTNGVYVNFLGDEGEARVREAYPGATYERLREVKRRYDPANFFRGNHNIRP